MASRTWPWACPSRISLREDGSAHGQVEVLSGAGGRHLRTLRAPRPQADASFGRALARLGDVTGDGIADLAVGVPYPDLAGEGGSADGQVEVLSGADGRHLRTLRAPRPQAFAFFGSALARLGDVNDDGIADLAVGVPYQDVAGMEYAGQVEVLSGADGRHLRTLRAPRPQAEAYFGWALARLGDVTDDGIPDLAVGVPTRISQAGACGQVEVFSGADGRHLRTLRASRPQADAYFGSVLVSLGDVNDDGVPDLAISAPEQDERGVEDLGRVFVFSGATVP